MFRTRYVTSLPWLRRYGALITVIEPSTITYLRSYLKSEITDKPGVKVLSSRLQNFRMCFLVHLKKEIGQIHKM